MIRRSLFITIFCLTLASAAIAQTKNISSEDFYRSYRAALKLFYEHSYRSIVRSEDYKNGVLVETNDWTYEYVKPDRKRYFEVRTSGNRVFKLESIEIGATKYCRKEDGEWKIVEGSCGTGGVGGPSNIKSETSTVENARINGRKVKIYRHRDVYERKNLGLSFWQTTFWLDEKDKLLREEMKVGLLEPERMSRTMVTTYQANPVDLKIEAPTVKPPRAP